MICKKCGNEIREGNTFCTNCGTSIINNEKKSDKQTISISLNRLVIIIIISLVLMVLLTFIILNHKKNISLNNNTNTINNETKMEEKIIDTSNEENTNLLDKIKAKYPTESENICTDGDSYWLLSADGDKVYFTDLESFEMAMEASFNIEHEQGIIENKTETNSKWLSDNEYYNNALEYLKKERNFIFSTTMPGLYHETKTSLINVDKNEQTQTVIVTIGLLNILSSSGGYSSSSYEFEIQLDINGDAQKILNSTDDNTNTSKLDPKTKRMISFVEGFPVEDYIEDLKEWGIPYKVVKKETTDTDYENNTVINIEPNNCMVDKSTVVTLTVSDTIYNINVYADTQYLFNLSGANNQTDNSIDKDEDEIKTINLLLKINGNIVFNGQTELVDNINGKYLGTIKGKPNDNYNIEAVVNGIKIDKKIKYDVICNNYIQQFIVGTFNPGNG